MAWKPGTTRRASLVVGGTARGIGLTSLALLALGVVAVTSATSSLTERASYLASKDVRHLIYAIGAAAVLCLGWPTDYRRLVGADLSRRFGAFGGKLPRIPTVMLAASLLLGAVVLLPGVGYTVGGKARWLRIFLAGYAIGFQPSEFIKLSLVIFLTAWLSRPWVDVRSFRKTFVPAVALIGLCMGLVVTQDFGTAAIIGVVGSAVLFLAGVRWRYLAGLAAAGAGAGWLFIAGSGFRMARIAALFDPWSTANPAAYQPRQSLLAVVSGGYFGKGLGNGMMKRGFLPEGQTDFIFATYCEEWGLAGALLLLGLLAIWVYLAGRAAAGAGDKFGRLLCGSLGVMIGFQTVLHVAVDLVVAPPTGVGLPLVSYGGTALLVAAASAAMMISVCVHRPQSPGVLP